MTDVGDLFVRIRPAPGTQAALTSEASGPVAAAGRDLSKIFLAAFAIGGIATTIKSVVTAASTHQAAFAVLNQTTKDAGASNELFGQSIETLLEKESRLKGFTDEDLASSFVRLVSATKDSAQAFKDLGLAEDVARARHIDLANAALAISKAEQGSATALQRLGIVVHPVTTAVDDLKTAHENAIIAGAKFTDQQKQIYQQALLNAAVQDKEATRLTVLSTLQQRFGGDAAVFAQTASGQFARLQADFHQFEVSIGTGLLSGLASASEAVGSFFTRAENNQGLRQGISTGLNDIKDVAETVGPPLLEIAKAALAVAKAVGGPEIIAGVAAYKAFGVIQGVVTSGQALYARALAASRGEVIADTDAQGQQTAAIVANTEAIQAQAAAATTSEARFAEAVTATTAAIDAQTVALERLAEIAVQVSAATIAPTIAAAETPAVVEAATVAPAATENTASLIAEQAALTDVSAAAATASTAEATYTETLIAGAPALAEITAGNVALAGALATVDAARAASIRESSAAAAAANTEATALGRLTAADTAAAIAAVRLGLATQATAAYFGESAVAADVLAASEERAALAASSGVLSGAGRLALAGVGGTAGVAAIGVGLLAAGIYKLVTAEDVGTAATHGLEHAVGNLNTSLHTDTVDKLTLAQDKLNLRQSEAALSASKAAHGSAEYQQLLLNVANDSLQVSDAQQALSASLAVTSDDFEKQRQKVQALADAAQVLALSQDLARRRGPDAAQPENKPAVQRAEATTFAQGIQQTIEAEKNLTPLQEHNLSLLEQFAEVFGRVPTQKQINLILANQNATIGLDDIRRKVEGLPAVTAAAATAAAAGITSHLNAGLVDGASKFGLGKAIQGQLDLLPGETAQSAISAGFAIWSQTADGIQAQANALGIGDIVKQQLDAIPAEAGANASAAGAGLGDDLLSGFASQVFPGFNSILTQINAEIAAGKKAAAEKQLNIVIDPLKQTIASDQADLANLQQNAKDTAIQGAQALAQAIDQAKQNLTSIGQSIAASLFTFIDQPLEKAAQRIQDAQSKLSLLGDKQSLQRLGEEVILPGDRRLSSDPQKAVAQLEALQKTKKSPALDAYVLQFRSLALQVEGDKNTVQQNAANLVKSAAESRLATLTDLFNTHRISQDTLERDVTSLLAHNGLTAKTARTRGVAFADTLSGELTGLKQQATAERAVGGGAGSGLIPSITRPIDTLNATQKSLAGIASSERAKQLSESKTQTTLLQKIHGAQAATKFTSSLDHNPGVKTKQAHALVGVGG